jgi:hypothetical protein
MKTTLMTFLRVAGSTGAAILNSRSLTCSGCAGDSLGQDFRRTEVVKPDLDIGRSKGRDYSRMKNRIEYCKKDRYILWASLSKSSLHNKAR